MGYEVKMYVGQVSQATRDPDDNSRYFMVNAMIDLCKSTLPVEELDPIHDQVYFYMEDGNTKMTQDHYGEPLKAYDGISVLQLISRVDPDYRRHKVAHALLNAMTEDFSPYELQVVFFGH